MESKRSIPNGGRRSIGQGLGISVFQNSLWNFCSFFLSALLAVILVRFVVNRIGINDFGLFGLVSAVLAPLTLANLGFGEATIKFVAEHARRGEWNRGAEFIRTTLFMNLLVGVVGAGLLLLFGAKLAFYLFRIQAEQRDLVHNCFIWVALGWIFNQAGAVFMGIPPALQKYRYVAIGNVLGSSVSSLLVFILVGMGMGIRGYAIATALGSGATCIVWWAISAHLLPGVSFRPRFFRPVWKKAFSFGGWQALAQFGGLASNQVERYVLGMFLLPAAVGVYNVALGFEQKAYLAAFKLSEVLFPLFSSLHGENLDRKADLLMRSSWLLTVLSVCVLCPIFPLSSDILRLWINADTADHGRTVLQTLVVAGLLGSATNASYFFLLGDGDTKSISFLALLTGGITIVTSIIVLPRFGLNGAGWSGVAAMVSQIIAVNAMLKRIFCNHLRFYQIFSSLYLPISLGLGLAFVVNYFGIVRASSWFELGVCYVALSVSFGVIVTGCSVCLPAGGAKGATLLRLSRFVVGRFQFAG